MEMKGLQDEFGYITYSASKIRCTLMQSINGQQPTMELVVLSDPCDCLFFCQQH